MVPVVNGLKSEYEGEVEFRLLNVEKDAEGARLADSFGAQYVPTFVFVNADGTQSGQLVGTQSEDQMRKELDKLD